MIEKNRQLNDIKNIVAELAADQFARRYSKTVHPRDLQELMQVLDTALTLVYTVPFGAAPSKWSEKQLAWMNARDQLARKSMQFDSIKRWGRIV